MRASRVILRFFENEEDGFASLSEIIAEKDLNDHAAIQALDHLVNSGKVVYWEDGDEVIVALPGITPPAPRSEVLLIPERLAEVAGKLEKSNADYTLLCVEYIRQIREHCRNVQDPVFRVMMGKIRLCLGMSKSAHRKVDYILRYTGVIRLKWDEDNNLCVEAIEDGSEYEVQQEDVHLGDLSGRPGDDAIDELVETLLVWWVQKHPGKPFHIGAHLVSAGLTDATVARAKVAATRCLAVAVLDDCGSEGLVYSLVGSDDALPAQQDVPEPLLEGVAVDRSQPLSIKESLEFLHGRIKELEGANSTLREENAALVVDLEIETTRAKVLASDMEASKAEASALRSMLADSRSDADALQPRLDALQSRLDAQLLVADRPVTDIDGLPSGLAEMLGFEHKL